jgi:hypothetical protein
MQRSGNAMGILVCAFGCWKVPWYLRQSQIAADGEKPRHTADRTPFVRSALRG